jgi:hypothetical protein
MLRTAPRRKMARVKQWQRPMSAVHGRLFCSLSSSHLPTHDHGGFCLPWTLIAALSDLLSLSCCTISYPQSFIHALCLGSYTAS